MGGRYYRVVCRARWKPMDDWRSAVREFSTLANRLVELAGCAHEQFWEVIGPLAGQKAPLGRQAPLWRFAMKTTVALRALAESPVRATGMHTRIAPSACPGISRIDTAHRCGYTLTTAGPTPAGGIGGQVRVGPAGLNPLLSDHGPLQVHGGRFCFGSGGFKRSEIYSPALGPALALRISESGPRASVRSSTMHKLARFTPPGAASQKRRNSSSPRLR